MWERKKLVLKQSKILLDDLVLSRATLSFMEPSQLELVHH